MSAIVETRMEFIAREPSGSFASPVAIIGVSG
jgi:hypothetical protein